MLHEAIKFVCKGNGVYKGPQVVHGFGPGDCTCDACGAVSAAEDLWQKVKMRGAASPSWRMPLLMK